MGYYFTVQFITYHFSRKLQSLCIKRNIYYSEPEKYKQYNNIVIDKQLEFINKNGSVNIGYVICRECQGYYQLEAEEHPDDFESCLCGGELIYSEHFDNLSTVLSFANMDEELQKKLNEILVIEQSIQEKTKPYYDEEETQTMLKKLTESFMRDK